VVDGVGAQSGAIQLLERDDAVLAARYPGDDPVGMGEFSAQSHR